MIIHFQMAICRWCDAVIHDPIHFINHEESHRLLDDLGGFSTVSSRLLVMFLLKSTLQEYCIQNIFNITSLHHHTFGRTHERVLVHVTPQIQTDSMSIGDLR